MKDLRNLPEQVRQRIAPALDLNEDPIVGFDAVQRNRRMEARLNPFELREADNEDPILDGYVVVYDYTYEVLGGPPFGWNETIRVGAGDKTVTEQDDVKFLFNHDGMALARTKPGTLTVGSDKHGVSIEARLDPTMTTAGDLIKSVRRGDTDQMSVGMYVTRQEWNDDYTDRNVTEFRMFDASAVTFPASEATILQLRSLYHPAPRRMSATFAAALVEQIRQ